VARPPTQVLGGAVVASRALDGARTAALTAAAGGTASLGLVRWSPRRLVSWRRDATVTEDFCASPLEMRR